MWRLRGLHICGRAEGPEVDELHGTARSVWLELWRAWQDNVSDWPEFPPIKGGGRIVVGRAGRSLTDRKVFFQF